MEKIELAIIGGGPGGYVAASVASRLGMNVTLFEKEFLGGTCLNSGCIPTKSYLSLSKIYTKLLKSNVISFENIKFNMADAKLEKDKIVERLRNDINILMKKRKVTIIPKEVKFKENYILSDGETDYHCEKILIATGSRPREIPPFKFDHKYILDSTDALNLTEIPENIAIIGGGVIGVELASFFNDVGVKIEVIELEKNILPTENIKIAKRVQSILKRKGINFNTGVSVKEYSIKDDGIILNLTNDKIIETSLVIVGVGRVRNSDSLSIENTDIKLQRDKILVDEYCETNIKNHYACGDVSTDLLLAHVASRMGEIAVKNMAGHKEKLNLELVPSCIYTHPELASIGLTKDIDKNKVITGKFMFGATGRAVTLGEDEGFVEIYSDKESGIVLGGVILGPSASELINIINYAINEKMTLESISHIIHPHPTLSEAVGEAFLTANGTPVHGL